MAERALQMSEKTIQEKQAEAQNWFREIRDQICSAFEGLEDALERGPHAQMEAGRFEREVWNRDDVSENAVRSPDAYAKGGGEISLMRGRVFEKVGVNISTVSGKFSEVFQREMPGGMETPYYWAGGISLVAHMRSPLVPAVHMNTRMICLGDRPWADQDSRVRDQGSVGARGENRGQQAEPLGAQRAEAQPVGAAEAQTKTKLWFGGGADLNPMFEVEEDTADFHNAFKVVCDGTDPAYYDAFKAWCDEYFYIPHRGEARGVGGIFYDYLGFNQGMEESIDNTKNFGGSNAHRGAHTQAGMQLTMADEKDWETRFEFTKAVGACFRDIYPEIARRHIHEEWSEQQRAWQLEKRGRYAEYNLLLDRGTRFGLMTGGNPKAILMSLPPEARWP